MTTEQKLKEQCTPEIIKKMVELAEGFEMYDSLNCIDFGGFSFPITEEDNEFYFYDTYIFPLLIHRAVEGWNKKNKERGIEIHTDSWYVTYLSFDPNSDSDDVISSYDITNYQPSSLTHCECACLHCLIEVLV